MNFSSDFLFTSDLPSLFTGIVFQFQYTSPLVVACGKFASANQQHFPDLGSDASSVWNLQAPFSNVISRGNQWWRREKSAVFSSYAQQPAQQALGISRHKKTRAREKETREGRGSACTEGPRKSFPAPNLITWQPLCDLSKVLTEND